jgi:glycosyltransferase 2 family protein
MRLLRIVFLAVGAGVLVWLVVRFSAGAIAASLAQVAWWQFILICLVYGFSMAVDTLGWRYAFASDRVPFRRLFAARVAGEAINVVTAVASVGGEAVKTWLVRRDVPYEESVPSVIVAKTAITVAQMLLLLLGIILAWTAVGIDPRLLKGMLLLLLLEVLGIGGFVATQVTGLIARTGRLLAGFGVAQAGRYGGRLDGALRSYYRLHWRRLLISLGCHFAGWLFSVAEAVLILAVIRVPASMAMAVVIEGFGSGVRFVTFLVPASLGALEGANVAVFPALGFTASAGLVFSLLRRARQAVWIGVGIVLLVVMRLRRPRD